MAAKHSSVFVIFSKRWPVLYSVPSMMDAKCDNQSFTLIHPFSCLSVFFVLFLGLDTCQQTMSCSVTVHPSPPSPSLKCNYCWWRSNASCVTDNQSQSVRSRLRSAVNWGTSISRHRGSNCCIFAQLKSSTVNWWWDSLCQQHLLFALGRIRHSPDTVKANATLHNICLKFAVKGWTGWHGHMTQNPPLLLQTGSCTRQVN